MMHIVHQLRGEAKLMKLSANEQRTVTARLQAAGVPVPLKDQSIIKPDLTIESLKGSRAFDLKRGSEYVFNARISNHSYGNLKVTGIHGHLLDENWRLTFQGDPKEHDPHRKTYRTPSGRYFRYKSVLNHRLRDEIAPGASVEGKLLAFNIFRRIPEEYLHGQLVELELILTDQYGRRFVSIIEVSVDRTATMLNPEVFDRVGRGLYEGSPRAPEFDLRVPSQIPVGKAETGESGKKQSESMKKLADCIAYVAKVESDSMLAEATSTRDEVGVDSRQRQKHRDDVRAEKGSGPYGFDAIGEPTDLFEKEARCRYLELLAHEKNAEQRRVAEIVDKK
jgi:hypothetical protein